MFAILTGTDRDETAHEAILSQLVHVATRAGFASPIDDHPIVADQSPLDAWSLSLKAPSGGSPDFLLSVTAPRMPGVSPIPVRNSVGGPVFAVLVMPSYLLVHRHDQRDVTEFTSVSDVEDSFRSFLRGLTAKT